MPRFILIHGNVDVPASFDALLPLLPPGPKLCVDLEHTFAAWETDQPVNAVEAARQLAGTYAIGLTDVLIGHSMGGWIVAHLKAQTGATAIQLNSWTNPRKINAPIRNLRLLKAVVASGIFQHRITVAVAKALYPFPASRERVRNALDRLERMNPAYLFWQYQLIFTPVPPLITLTDLRIHTHRDRVIRTPDEPFVAVPGDHVAHKGYPVVVAAAINNFIASLRISSYHRTMQDS